LNSNIINFNDLAVAREIIPFGLLRLQILRNKLFGTKIIGGCGTLVVTPCIVGDCLSYLPAVQAFAEKSHTRFDILVSPDFRSLAERLRGVSHVFVANSSYNRITEQQNSSDQVLPLEYDRIVVLRLSWHAYKQIKHIRCRNLVSSDAALLEYVFHLGKSSLLKRPVKQSREVMFNVFGFDDVSQTSRYYDLFNLNHNDEDVLTDFPSLQCHENRVLIHMGSGWKVKLWNDDMWVKLVERIHASGAYRFFFVGRGDEEKMAFEKVRERLNFEVYSLINAANLWELFLVMKRSNYLIGIDSGPRNLAHYANLRSVTLLNPAAVKNFLPLDGRDIVVEKPNRFPANIVNTKRSANLTSISVDEVFEAFMKLTENRAAIAQSREKATA
jgi:ADP-heptose:LPS heptosyltransferase